MWRQRTSLTIASLAVALSTACIPSESEIRSDVQQRLDADQTTAPLKLSVSVDKRVVRLAGKTMTAEEQERAMTLARAADGVRLVMNEMWVNNIALANKVKQALAGDAQVGKIPIEVDARGAVVKLKSDQTTADDRARIVKIAWTVEGVMDVEDYMK
jgi:osmotically-inducible protein OsmY